LCLSVWPARLCPGGDVGVSGEVDFPVFFYLLCEPVDENRKRNLVVTFQVLLLSIPPFFLKLGL
jgi:hypothetical protein